MKKTFIIAATLVVTSVSSFAQGWITWASSVHDMVNNFATPGTPIYSSGIDAALLFYTGSAPAFTSTFSSTNSANAVSSADWAALMSGAIVVDGAPSLSSTPAVASDAGAGSFSYNSGTAWNALNITGGQTYTAVEVAWYVGAGDTITTLAAAVAANSTIGWTAAFSYTPSTTSTSVPALNSTLDGPVGVDDVVSSVPEPCTLALAGLGGLGLLALRRKK